MVYRALEQSTSLLHLPSLLIVILEGTFDRGVKVPQALGMGSLPSCMVHRLRHSTIVLAQPSMRRSKLSANWGPSHHRAVRQMNRSPSVLLYSMVVVEVFVVHSVVKPGTALHSG